MIPSIVEHHQQQGQRRSRRKVGEIGGAATAGRRLSSSSNNSFAAIYFLTVFCWGCFLSSTRSGSLQFVSSFLLSNQQRQQQHAFQPQQRGPLFSRTSMVLSAPSSSTKSGSSSTTTTSSSSSRASRASAGGGSNENSTSFSSSSSSSSSPSNSTTSTSSSPASTPFPSQQQQQQQEQQQSENDSEAIGDAAGAFENSVLRNPIASFSSDPLSPLPSSVSSTSVKATAQRRVLQQQQRSRSAAAAAAATSTRVTSSKGTAGGKQQQRQPPPPRRARYQRKRAIPETELELMSVKRSRQQQYEETRSVAGANAADIWSFESLFPEPVWDEETIKKDLFGVKERDLKTAAEKSATGAAAQKQQQQQKQREPREMSRMRSALLGASSMMRVWREPKNSYLDSLEKQTKQMNAAQLMNNSSNNAITTSASAVNERTSVAIATSDEPAAATANVEKSNMKRASQEETVTSKGDDIIANDISDNNQVLFVESNAGSMSVSATGNVTFSGDTRTSGPKVDRDLTRMVENSVYGYRRTPQGVLYQYDTSLMGVGAVKFRDGVRLGNPLTVNADRLNYFAKKELQHGRVEEAQELYERAVQIDRRDGRAYLGLCRCAQRRRDFKLAREYLKTGITNSVSVLPLTSATTGSSSSLEDIDNNKNEMEPDRGANPFLTQALGCLEERMGRLSQAEALYISAVRSRPSHAAAWVALAQLRTRKLGQSASAGRYCYEAAERELRRAGKPPSSYVYTAWADMEFKKAGDTRRARDLFKLALKVDPKCSAAWLQLGTLEAHLENWKEAQNCFDTVLKFDQRNSRVIQAYAIMETKRPDGNSRKAIGLFERALQVNPRDAGVLQAYALYVAKLGDIDSARNLLEAGTKADKRHAAVWQAWGVMESTYGSPDDARKIFQEGIWACAQLSGNQSGGYRCARLWQSWGVLEARERDYAAARRCFSRALDADRRNVPAVTAWALMEEKLGNEKDARWIFEQALPLFAAGSEDKMSIWRNYELMEQRLGNLSEAQHVYMRYMRETLTISDRSDSSSAGSNVEILKATAASNEEQRNERKNEVEVSRWVGGGEVWLNDRAVESKVPFSFKNRRKNKN